MAPTTAPAQGFAGFKAPVFVSVKFIPGAQKAGILAKPVSAIIEVAHKKEVKPGQKGRTNHWVFYLVTGATESVRIDCTPSGLPGTTSAGTTKANIVISALAYRCSTNVESGSMTSLKPKAGTTVKTIVDIITANGMDKYEFNKEGTGCRFWNSCMLDLMVKAGVVAQADVTKAKASILKLWPSGNPLALDKGAFYK